MTPEQVRDSAFDLLMATLAERPLSETESQHLEQLLIDNPEYREVYARYLCVVAMLHRTSAVPSSIEGFDAPASPTPRSGRRPGRRGSRRPLFRKVSLLAVAAVMVFAAVVAISVLVSVGVKARRAAASGPAVATLVDAVDATWDPPTSGPMLPASIGSQLPSGNFKLRSGTVHLAFASGAQITLTGPAELALNSPMHAFLREGKLVAHVPPSAHGFTIAAPGCAVIDLGTAFQMTVAPDRGALVRVLEGRVEFHTADAGGTGTLLVEGDTADLPAGAATAAIHRGAPDKGFTRWAESSRRLRNDPSLVAYYDFDTGPGEDPHNLLNRAATGPMFDGLVNDATPIPGRWPEKGALQFNRPDQSVRITIPEPLTSLTLAAWVRLDEEPNTGFSTIISSDYWSPGKVSMDVGPGNVPRFNYYAPAGTTLTAKPLTALDLGHWTQFVATYDGQTGEMALYVNGERAASRRAPKHLVFTIGSALIGSWKMLPGYAPRPLVGAIDELAIFKRPLTAAEIQNLYNAGRVAPHGS